MEYTDEELIKKYLDSIETKPFNTKKLFAIGFVGLTGIGKSFVAEKLSEKLGLFIASNDKIRRFLNKLGYNGASPVQETVQKIAEASSEYLYEKGVGHIIDADLIKFHSFAKEFSKHHRAELFIIHIICPEKIILERLKSRAEKLSKDSSASLSRVGEEEYFKRKELHASLPLPKVFFTVDSSKELNEQIDELINKLRKRNVL